MMKPGEPHPDKTLVELYEPLSFLMASQVKGTIHGGESRVGQYTITTMIHPDPQTLEQSNRFTVTVPVHEDQYYKLYGESDLTHLLANIYKDHLYQAAIDAYDHSVQKVMDDAKKQQAVSEIKIRNGMDGNTYISCQVFGERQLAKKMDNNDIEYYRMRMAASDKAYNGVAPELAQKYFKEEISNALDTRQSRSLSR